MNAKQLPHKLKRIRKHMSISGMLEGGRQGMQMPPQILADQKAPPGSGGAPHYYLPTQILAASYTPARYVRTRAIISRSRL